MLAGIRFLFRDRLLRVWTPAFTLLDIVLDARSSRRCRCSSSTKYGADPRILGWLFGALGGGALVGALGRAPARRGASTPLSLTSVAFLCQMAAMWLAARTGAVGRAARRVAVGGFFMSLVNSPMQALMMLRMPRHLRPQALAGPASSSASPRQSGS